MHTMREMEKKEKGTTPSLPDPSYLALLLEETITNGSLSLSPSPYFADGAVVRYAREGTSTTVVD